MSLEVARDRLARQPRLGVLVTDAWLNEQFARPVSARHPLYSLLEWDVAEQGVETFLDGLERTLKAPIGGAVVSRARRLMQGVGPRWSDYWSAVDELSTGARLVDCCLSVRFGNPEHAEPDLVIAAGAETVLLEMTSREISAELSALQAEITSGWTAHMVATLHIGRGAFRPTATLRGAIVGRVRDIAERTPPVEIEVNLSDLVEPALLRVTVGPTAGWGYVSSISGGAFRSDDLLPAIEEAIDRKRGQIKHLPAVSIGVALDSLTFDPHTWALRHLVAASFGGALPEIEADSNVQGVVAFIRGVPGQQPAMALWLANRHQQAPMPRLLAAVLDSLGAGADPDHDAVLGGSPVDQPGR